MTNSGSVFKLLTSVALRSIILFMWRFDFYFKIEYFSQLKDIRFGRSFFIFYHNERDRVAIGATTHSGDFNYRVTGRAEIGSYILRGEFNRKASYDNFWIFI